MSVFVEPKIEGGSRMASKDMWDSFGGQFGDGQLMLWALPLVVPSQDQSRYY